MNPKERIRIELIRSASIYQSILMDYDYLIYSEAFKSEPHYILTAHGDNYAHLTGVHSLVSASEFYSRCLNGTLTVSDFDFVDKYQSEKSVRNTVRKKLSSFSYLPHLFSQGLKAEESFSKGKVHCFIAAANNNVTLGFVETEEVLPKTLLKGNLISEKNSVDITLMLRRSRGSNKFDTILHSDVNRFHTSHSNILSETLFLK